MATQQNQKVGFPKIIGAISQFAGALVGTAVITGKRIIKTAARASGGASGKPEKKSVQAPFKKKAAVKTKAKGRKVKKKAIKKKVAKRKKTGLPRKGKAPKKKIAQSSAKKKKSTTAKKKQQAEKQEWQQRTNVPAVPKIVR